MTRNDAAVVAYEPALGRPARTGSWEQLAKGTFRSATEHLALALVAREGIHPVNLPGGAAASVAAMADASDRGPLLRDLPCDRPFGLVRRIAFIGQSHFFRLHPRQTAPRYADGKASPRWGHS